MLCDLVDVYAAFDAVLDWAERMRAVAPKFRIFKLCSD